MARQIRNPQFQLLRLELKALQKRLQARIRLHRIHFRNSDSFLMSDDNSLDLVEAELVAPPIK
jgi:hypothetical protein